MRIRAGTLEVALTADGSEFQSALKQADSVSEAFATNVTSRMKRARAGFEKLGEAVGATAGEWGVMESEMRQGIAMDAAARQLDNLVKYCGLTRKEADSLAARIGLLPKEVQTLEKKIQDGGAAFSYFGKEAGLTEKEMASLEKRMREGMSADTAARALNNLRKYAGLTAQEYSNLAAKMGIATKESDKASISLAGIAKRAGAAAAAYVSLREVAKISSDSFAAFRDYESALTDMARVTDQSLGNIDAQIKSMPRDLGDPTALMQGYYQVLSSGAMDTAAAMDLLTTAAKASKAAHVEQSETVKALTKLMAGFDGEIKSAAEASDLLFRIDNLGQTSFAELVPVIGDVAEVTHLVGVSAEEMAAGLALITQTSGSTAEASTKWKAIMVGLYKPTENMEKVLKALGYSSGQAMVEQEGFAGALQKLQAVAEKSGFTLGKLFESSEALTGIAGLSAQEWGRYVNILHAVEVGANETDQAYQRWLKTSQAVKDAYDATLRQMAIEFGGELAPLMTKGMENFSSEVMADKDAVVTALGGIVTAIDWITSALMAATREYQMFSNSIAAGIAVVKREMSFTDWAMSGPDELVKKLQAAGDRLRDENKKQALESKTKSILTSDNTGTISELSTMFGGDLSKQVTPVKKSPDVPTVALKKPAKERGANDSVEKYAEGAAAFLDQVKNTIASLEDSLSGGLESEVLKVDKTFDGLFSQIRKHVVGAKGDVSDYATAWTLLEQALPGARQVAAIKDFEKELDKAAQYARDMGNLLADPVSLEKADWLEGYKKYIQDLREARAQSDQADADAVANAQARWDAYQSHLLKSQLDRLGEGGKLSSAYWESERQALEKQLAAVKANCDSEYAYEAYAAKQRSDLRQKEIEARINYEQDFLSTLKDQLSLEFGLYKDDLTQKHDGWISVSKDIASGVHDLSGTIASSATDAFKGWITGSESMADAFKNAGDSMLDYFMGIIQKMIAYALDNYVTIPILQQFVGSDAASGILGKTSGAVDAVTNAKTSGGSTDYSALTQIGTAIGQSSGDRLTDNLTSQTDLGIVIGDVPDIGKSIGSEINKSAGDVWSASSSLWAAGGSSGWSAGTFSKAVAKGTAGGWKDVLGGIGAGTGIGTAIGSAMGASTTASLLSSGLGSALGAAIGSIVPGVGTLLGGIIGGTGGGLLSSLFGGGGETKTEQTGTGYSTFFQNDEAYSTGWTSYRNTTSGGMGAASISHSKSYSPLTPDQQSEIKELFAAYSDNMLGAFSTLGLDKASTALHGFDWPMFDWTEDQKSDVVKNINTAKMWQSLSSEGLLNEFGSLADGTTLKGKDLESQLEALTKSYSTVSQAAGIYGLSLDKLAAKSGTMSATAETLANAWGRSLPGETPTATPDLIQSLRQNNAQFQAIASAGAGGNFGMVLAAFSQQNVDAYTGGVALGKQVATEAASSVASGVADGLAQTAPADIAVPSDGQTNVNQLMSSLVASGATSVTQATQSAVDAATQTAMGYAYQEMDPGYAAKLQTLLEAQYAQLVLDAFKGDSDAVTAAYKRYATHSLSQLEQLEDSKKYYTEQLVSSLTSLGYGEMGTGQLDDAIEGFWGRYKTAMTSGYLAPEDFARWDQAAAAVEQIDAASASIAELGGSLENVAGIARAVQTSIDAVSDSYANTITEATTWRKSLDTEFGNITDFAQSYIDDFTSAYQTIHSLDLGKAYQSYTVGFGDEITPEESSAWVGGIKDMLLSYIRSAAKVLKDPSVTYDTEQSVIDALGSLDTASDPDWWFKLAAIVQNTVAFVDALPTEVDGLIASLAAQKQALIDLKMDAYLDSAGWTDAVAEIQKSDTERWLEKLKTAFEGLNKTAEALGASTEELAKIQSDYDSQVQAKLTTVMESVTSQWDESRLTDSERWLADLRKSMQQATEDATTLGASEAQLSQIRQAESEIIANKLSSMMDSVAAELSKFDGTELSYSIAAMKKEYSGKLYDAALLGASEADLTQVGMLYAYKVKDLYQQQIDTIISQLETAADALDKFSDSLKDFLEGLWRNDSSPLGLEERYAETKRQWLAGVADLGSADDAVREAAQGKIQGLTTDFLSTSKDYNSTPEAYYADFIQVQKILGDQYTQAKSEYDLLYEQLKAAKGTEENTKSTAELMDQLKSLQQQQGDTWTQMLADLPAKIAAAIAQAQAYKQQLAVGGAAGTAAGGGSVASVVAAEQLGAKATSQYLSDKAAQLNAQGYQGRTDWNASSVANAIADAGLTPLEHYKQYGQGEGLSWLDPNATLEASNPTSTGWVYNFSGYFGSDHWSTDGQNLDFLDPASYLQAKAAQLAATTGRAWTVEEVAKALTDAGLTIGQHYDQYGRNEGIGAGSGYTGGSASGFDTASYIAAKTAELNATNEGGHSWTAAETAAAIAAAGLTPEQHYAEYGQYENIPGYAAGGYIPGYSAEDVLPAMLRLGEYVVTPEAVQHYGVSLLDSINSRSLPRPALLPGYATGGAVGLLDDTYAPSAFRSGSTLARSNDATVVASLERLAETVNKMSTALSKKLDKISSATDYLASTAFQLRQSSQGATS